MTAQRPAGRADEHELRFEELRLAVLERRRAALELEQGDPRRAAALQELIDTTDELLRFEDRLPVLLDLPARALSIEATLAGLATVIMAGMTAATAVWWGVLASVAPWFLGNAPYGTPSSAADPDLIGIMTLMLTATLLAAIGTTRALRGSRALTRPA